MSVPAAHEGILFCAGRALVALKIAKDEDIMARIIREQLKLTPRRANLAMRTRVLTLRSRACSLSVPSSRFSRTSSSRKVGLRGFVKVLAGVPGTFMALLRGDLGGMATSWGLLM